MLSESIIIHTLSIINDYDSCVQITEGRGKDNVNILRASIK